jgi:ferredoxin-NADP reductase
VSLRYEVEASRRERNLEVLPSDDGTIEVRVKSVTWESPSTASVVLLPSDDEPLPAFGAGAHIDVYTPGGTVRPIFNSAIY